MITRAYVNAKGERQEVTLAAEQWDALTEADLDNMLGFGKAAKSPEPVVEAAPEPVAEEAPAAEEAPVAEKAPAKKGK